MSHAIARRASWLEMPRVLVPIGLAIALVFLVFAAALSAERSTEETLAGAQADLLVTRDVISAHATTMRVQGERLLQMTTSSESPHRDHWASDARQMIADALRLDATAKLIDSQARLLGEHPGSTVRSDLSFIHGVGDGLVAEGDGLVTHGQAMREHGLAMEELARVSETEIAAADAGLLRSGADQLVDAGQRARSVGSALQSVGAQFMRSLGR
jgi:hypothetical protein